MYINLFAILSVYALVLSYFDGLLRARGTKPVSLTRNAVSAALFIVPVVGVGLYDWRVGAAAVGARAIAWAVVDRGMSSMYTEGGAPSTGTQLPVEELELALATGLTGEALANDIATRRAAHEAMLAGASK